MKTAKPRKMGKTSRVVVCGMAGVGKTAILEQLIFGNITPATVSLLQYYRKMIIIEKQILKNCIFIGVVPHN